MLAAEERPCRVQAILLDFGGVLAEADWHWPYWLNLALVAVLLVLQLVLRGTWLARHGPRVEAYGRLTEGPSRCDP